MLRFRSRVLRFRDLGASFSILGASFSSFGCFVFEIWVLRASVFVFECFVFETTDREVVGSNPVETNFFFRVKKNHF